MMSQIIFFIFGFVTFKNQRYDKLLFFNLKMNAT